MEGDGVETGHGPSDRELIIFLVKSVAAQLEMNFKLMKVLSTNRANDAEAVSNLISAMDLLQEQMRRFNALYPDEESGHAG